MMYAHTCKSYFWLRNFIEIRVQLRAYAKIIRFNRNYAIECVYIYIEHLAVQNFSNSLKMHHLPEVVLVAECDSRKLD